MTGHRRKGFALGIAMLALVVGAGAALAGGGLGFGKDDRQALLNDAAKRLDVTPEKLQEALLGAYGDRLDAAVAAGTITKAQADELKQRAKDNGGLPFFGGGGRDGFGPHFGDARGGLHLDAAAAYLGLTQAELRTELESGKTLAEIATAKGKTVSGLKQALSDAVKSDLDAAVKAGKFTQAQADELLADLKARLDDVVAGKARPGFGTHIGHVRGGLHLDAAATYLGLTQAELRTELESGKTLAEIATAKGKTVSGLKQALSDAVKSDLDAAVKAGKLTQAQADELLTDIKARLDDVVAGKAGTGFGHHRFGPLPGPGLPGAEDTRPAPSSFVLPI